VGERLAGGGDISPVRGDAGLRDPDPDLFFDPGPAESGAGRRGLPGGRLYRTGSGVADQAGYPGMRQW